MLDKILAIIIALCGGFFGFLFMKSEHDRKKNEKEELQKKQKVIDHLYKQSEEYKKYQEKMADEKDKAQSHNTDGFNASFDLLQNVSEDGRKRQNKS